jgi:hypothetical protein
MFKTFFFLPSVTPKTSAFCCVLCCVLPHGCTLLHLQGGTWCLGMTSQIFRRFSWDSLENPRHRDTHLSYKGNCLGKVVPVLN